MKRKKTIGFCGGGTAGHVFPALSVIHRLADQWGGRIFWIGSRSGMEKGLVTRADIPFYGIPAGKWRRYFSLSNFFDLFKILGGWVGALTILIREKPLLLFSKGGYVSVPPVLAARFLGIPIWTHESDYDPGLATRITAPLAEKIFVSYRETERFFRPGERGKVLCTGNPIRSGFKDADPDLGHRYLGVDDRKKILLILGGSQGARSINRVVADILLKLTERWVVVHQTGEGEEQPEARESYRPVPFLGDELPHVLAAADLVVCRAGAATLAELAYLGKTAILIPLGRDGSRGDQLRNSAYFESRQAALVLRYPTPEDLYIAIDTLSRDRKRCGAMSREMKRLSRPDAACEIARLVAQRIA